MSYSCIILRNIFSKWSTIIRNCPQSINWRKIGNWQVFLCTLRAPIWKKYLATLLKDEMLSPAEQACELGNFFSRTALRDIFDYATYRVYSISMDVLSDSLVSCMQESEKMIGLKQGLCMLVQQLHTCQWLCKHTTSNKSYTLAMVRWLIISWHSKLGKPPGSSWSFTPTQRLLPEQSCILCSK